jgi:hypothetical protein
MIVTVICLFYPFSCLQACAAVGNLANDNELNRDRLGSVGACKAVVSALTKHGKSNAVLAHRVRYYAIIITIRSL